MAGTARNMRYWVAVFAAYIIGSICLISGLGCEEIKKEGRFEFLNSTTL